MASEFALMIDPVLNHPDFWASAVTQACQTDITVELISEVNLNIEPPDMYAASRGGGMTSGNASAVTA